MTSDVRWHIRHERDRMVRVRLRSMGYVLDYYLVYRASDLAPAVGPGLLLRSVARGSSRRRHEERMSAFL